MASVRILEVVQRAPLLGIRCLDAATGAPVRRGLMLTAYRLDALGRGTAARVSASGHFVFHDLPGMREFAFSEPPAAANPPPPAPANLPSFAIFIEDPEDRYLGGAIRPRSRVIDALLFSAPSRPAVPGLAALRGAVSDSTRPPVNGEPAPAAFARIEVRHLAPQATDPFVGFADERGQFVVLMPLPNPLLPPAGVAATSPNVSARATIDEMRWPVEVSFFYQPSAQQAICRSGNGRTEVVSPAAPAPADAARCVKDLGTLHHQAAATLNVVLSPPAASPPTSLQVHVAFADETVLRTAPDRSDIPLVPAPPSSP